MCGDLFRKWLVLVVCVCGVAAAGEPNELVAEANEPWIAAEHLAPGWESMTLATRLFNHEIPIDRPMPPRRSLSFGGWMYVIDPNGLIGLSEVVKSAKVFDEVGYRIQVEYTPQATTRYGPPLQGPSYQPLEYRTKVDADTKLRIASPEPFNFTIDMSMGYNAPFPLALSRLEWSMSALRSDHIEAIDIPFAPTGNWTELVPGLEVLVEQATVEEGKYRYRMKTRYDPNRISYLDVRDSPPCYTGHGPDVPYSWPWHAYPEMIVTAIDMLDAEGNSVTTQSTEYRISGGTTFKDSGGQRIVTQQYTGTCSECTKAAFIRHVIAFKPYNQDLQFVLENVPVPTF